MFVCFQQRLGPVLKFKVGMNVFTTHLLAPLNHCMNKCNWPFVCSIVFIVSTSIRNYDNGDNADDCGRETRLTTSLKKKKKQPIFLYLVFRDPPIAAADDEWCANKSKSVKKARHLKSNRNETCKLISANIIMSGVQQITHTHTHTYALLHAKKIYDNGWRFY